MWWPFAVEDDSEVTPPQRAPQRITEMALTDVAPTPECYRCGAADAGYRIDLKPVCIHCVSWLDHIRLVNRGVFDA